MAVSRSQRLKLMHSAEASGVIAPDNSAIIHSFADGWTIRRLETGSDIWREGMLMRNCLRQLYRRIQQRGPIDEMAAADLVEMAFKRDIACFHSLRDPNNLPRLTFYTRERVWGVGSYRNGRRANEYIDRMNEWLDQIGLARLEYSAPAQVSAPAPQALAEAGDDDDEPIDADEQAWIDELVVQIADGSLQRDIDAGRFITYDEFAYKLIKPDPAQQRRCEAAYADILGRSTPALP